jgi:hypothetical protein
MKMTAFWECFVVSLKQADVSEVHTASIIISEEYTASHHGGSSTHL